VSFVNYLSNKTATCIDNVREEIAGVISTLGTLDSFSSFAAASYMPDMVRRKASINVGINAFSIITS